MSDAETPLFEAVIVPHRSLSRCGTITLVAALCIPALIVSVLSVAWGAWPIAGFDVADIVLAVLLLLANRRARRASETLTLTDRSLHIVRRDPAGRQESRRLSLAWLNAVLEERPGRVPALWLVASGTREQVATALGEEEKRDLADALRTALYCSRNPIFDNAQLRDDRSPHASELSKCFVPQPHRIAARPRPKSDGC